MAKVGFGIIGCGNIGPIHAEAIAQVKNARLVAVSDLVETSAKALAGKYGADAYTDYRQMLERKDVDAVCLCVPSGFRGEIGPICAQAGKHILAEKPLEITTKRIDRLITIADKAKIKLGCVFQSRFADGTLRIQEAIDKGRFGRLVLGDAYVKWYRSPEYYASGAWRGTRAIDGGGALMNQGIHTIDLLLSFFGEVKQVQAQTRTLAHEGLEVEDLACAVVEFTSGALGVIEGSTATWPGHAARVEVHGTDGGAIIEDGDLKFWQFQKETKADKAIREALNAEAAAGAGAADPLSNLKCEGHRRQIADFVKSIIEDKPLKVDGREARRSVELIESIYKSAETGKAVKIKR